jgi:hypothetical protein
MSIAEPGDQRMKRPSGLSVAKALLVAGIALSCAAQADFELTGADGRRILLKDNGTWRYVEPVDKDLAEDKTKEAGEAVLFLERKIERGIGCRFVIRLVNDLPYEISSFVPYFSAYRANGVIYDTVSPPSSFTGLKPGDKQSREFEVIGIACKDIVRLQVVGGDKCVMGELNLFTDAKGACLARVRVVGSDLVRFDK